MPLSVPVYIGYFDSLYSGKFNSKRSLETKLRNGRVLCQIIGLRNMTPSANEAQFGQTLTSNFKNEVMNSSAGTISIFPSSPSASCSMIYFPQS